MPHPEHAVEDLCGPGTDGLGFFTSVVSARSQRRLTSGSARSVLSADPARRAAQVA